MLITQILAPWPFDMWRIDILTLFSMTTRQRKFLIVAIDYFIKWVEAKFFPTSLRRNLKTSSGSLLFAGLDCLDALLLIIDDSLITKYSENSTQIYTLSIGFHQWGTHNPIRKYK